MDWRCFAKLLSWLRKRSQKLEEVINTSFYTEQSIDTSLLIYKVFWNSSPVQITDTREKPRSRIFSLRLTEILLSNRVVYRIHILNKIYKICYLTDNCLFAKHKLHADYCEKQNWFGIITHFLHIRWLCDTKQFMLCIKRINNWHTHIITSTQWNSTRCCVNSFKLTFALSNWRFQ